MTNRSTKIITLLTLLASSTNGFSPSYNNNVQRTKYVNNGDRTKAPTTELSMTGGSNANELVPLKQGSTVALVTPYLPNGEIDFPSLRKLLQMHKEAGTDGLCILGTTGEAALMTMAERKAILDVAVEEVKGHIPILVGTGSINPADVREATLQAIDCGCDASLVVTPPYIKPPQRGLINHFTSMADMGLPVVVYNVPGRTGVDVPPETIAICAEHENIVGVKEATGDVTRVAAIRELTSNLEKPLLLYSGDDATEAEFVLLGGDGCISVTANVAPKSMHEMMMAGLKGDKDEAMRINASLESMHNNIFCESNPIPAKWALKRMGIIANGYCRPPLSEMDSQYTTIVEESMKKAGIL